MRSPVASDLCGRRQRRRCRRDARLTADPLCLRQISSAEIAKIGQKIVKILRPTDYVTDELQLVHYAAVEVLEELLAQGEQRLTVWSV